jgi:hypothetical protein
MREAADKSGVKYEETEGGYAVSGGPKKERPHLKVIEGGKEKKPTLMISSEKERQEMFDELTKSFSDGKMEIDQFTEKYNDIYQAEVEETLVEATKITPDQYIELQDTIRAQFKDPKEQAEKLALLDETTELVVDEEAEAKPEEEEYSLENLIANANKRIEAENKATSSTLREAATLLEDGTIKFTEAQTITTEAFADKKAKELREGKTDLAEAITFREMLKENTEGLNKAIADRKLELAKQAREEMNKGIDTAHDEGELPFSSKEFSENWRAYEDQAKKIQDELGINAKNPGFSDRLRMQAMKLQPAKWKAYFAPLEKFRNDYEMNVNQVTDKAPQSLSSKPLAELQRAGMVSAAKIPEKTLAPEEKLEKDLESGEISLNEYLKITNAADKVREGLEAKHRKNLADIEILRNTPSIMKGIDEMKKEGVIDISSTDYQKAVHDLYTSKQWLETNANYDPNKGFFANWARAREAQIDMSQYKKHRKQYLEAEIKFQELNSILEKANFWGEAEIIEAIAPAATEPQGPEAPTPSTTKESAPDTTKRTNA